MKSGGLKPDDIRWKMIQRWDAARDSESLRRRFAAGTLKVCPLCGTLNVEEASECFVCWWAGEFERSSAVVDLKICELVERCPELVGLMKPAQRSGRVIQFFRRLVCRLRNKLDVFV